LGQLGMLTRLDLSINQLSGSIPASLGDLSLLTGLILSNNQLNGSIPASLCAVPLSGGVDFSFNKLSASDPCVDNIDPDWEESQTVPPSNVQAQVLSSTAVQLTWTPILYTEHGGYYEVLQATTPGGPYTAVGRTANKSDSTLTVNNLTPGTTYFFVVRTFTPKHDPPQQNDLLSDNSAEVSATTTPIESTITIIKDAQPNSRQNFRFSGDLGNFRLDNVIPSDTDEISHTKTFTVASGIYTVTEQLPANWLLATIMCDPAAGAAVDLVNSHVTLTLAEESHITCTFTNQRKSIVRVLKYEDHNGDARRNEEELVLEEWTMRLYNAQQTLVEEAVTNAHGKVSFTGLHPGNYTVCEELTASWFNTQPGFSDPTFQQPCYVLTLGVGQTAQVKFGNVDHPVVSASPPATSDGVVIFDAPDDEVNDENYDVIDTDEVWLNTPDAMEGLFLPLIGTAQ
jgi:hypothetical protein